MSLRFTVVEMALNRVEFRWKWLRFWQHTFLLGAALAFGYLAVGAAIMFGWITTKGLAAALWALLGGVGFVAWAIIIITAMLENPDRKWLAGEQERVDRRLRDRLNSLVFLEGRSQEPRARSFAERIAQQMKSVLAAQPSPLPFSPARTLAMFAGFVLLVAATIQFYSHYSPWQHVAAAQKLAAAQAARADNALDLAPPATNNAEQQQLWGEVRITDPGTDLKVTKVDVVPLQIEAAANQSLSKVGWYSTINGTEEAPHPLPPPSEPRYAVYQPTLYLDELRLADWDVMTYYAKASTEGQNSYASDVYFLEVRPFREDILKMPGGEGGKAYSKLSELSKLIDRQQHIIRQTHLHLQKPAPQENLQAQDRKKLAEAEADLKDSVQHLYADMANEMENAPIGEALDNLGKAEKSLDRASQLLADNIMSEAQNRERSALTDLVAARKMFQKAVSEHPEAFQEGDPQEENPPTAESSKKLNEIAEFRNEARAAEDFVQKTLQQQRALEQQARATPRSGYPALGEQEQQLQESLNDFQEQHPQVFKGAEQESRQTQEAMGKAADSLKSRATEARAATQEATRQTEKLAQAMKNRSASQQLADAYKLKEMLDKQVHYLEKNAQPDAQPSEQGLQQTAGQARETIQQLQRVAEQEPTRDAFGPPLRDSLSGSNKVDLEAKLNRLAQPSGSGQPGGEASPQQRAGDAGQALKRVSQAFERSEPKALQMARKGDALKPGDQDSFSQGMAELDSLIKQLENQRPISEQDRAKQGSQALMNLQNGMRSQFGDNSNAQQILLQLQELLKGQKPMEVADLKKLMETLQRFSVETAEKRMSKENPADLANIDPSRLPPTYRGRIQKYFQKLSENQKD